MLTRRIVPKQKTVLTQAKVVQEKTNLLSLPTKKSLPSDNLGDYTWLIYGQKKIGKTSFAAQFPDALFMMFEPGGKALEIYQVDCDRWDNALEYLKLLEEAKKKGELIYKTIVIDTGFEAYQKCMNYVCEQLNIAYPREDNFGKDWAAIKTEFRTFQNRVMQLGLGFIVLCHERMKESQTRTGSKFDMIIPNLQNPADDYFRATIDNVCWYHYRNRERFLLIKGSDYAMAGSALSSEKHFLTKDGKQVCAIPMGKSAKESYNFLINAFQNKQVNSYEEETTKFMEDSIRESVQKNIKKKR